MASSVNQSFFHCFVDDSFALFFGAAQ